jgi:hypothetical protein
MGGAAASSGSAGGTSGTASGSVTSTASSAAASSSSSGSASCGDGVKNGDETDVDCGGSCPECNGSPCNAAGECAGGFCVDGRCCDTACTGTCYSCNVSGSAGTCSPLPLFTDDSFPDDACTGMNTCNGAGACKLKNGENCDGIDDKCASNNCAGAQKTCL